MAATVLSLLFYIPVELFPDKALSMFITTPGVAASGATNFQIMFSTYILQGSFDNCASEMVFSLKHYRGISVVINLELVSEYPPQTLAESGIDILEFKEKFCADGKCFIMRAKDEIEHIMDSLSELT